MRSQADLLYNEQNCFPGQNSVEKNCTFDQYTALRNGCAIDQTIALIKKTLFRYDQNRNLCNIVILCCDCDFIQYGLFVREFTRPVMVFLNKRQQHAISIG